MQQGRLKQFSIREYDAWGQKFFYTIIEEKENGDKCILVKTLQDSFSIDLFECEDSFVEDLIRIDVKNMNGWSYYHKSGIVDGWGWTLEITYDNVSVISTGDNVYPYEYAHLREYMKDKWKIPFASKLSKTFLKDRRKRKMTDLEIVNTNILFK